ncbi:MAG: VCBS repeat-containing protein [Phycisphaerae bacterium]|nr:VCBS repeat-containing protein [Phycisphaerae bacterium]
MNGKNFAPFWTFLALAIVVGCTPVPPTDDNAAQTASETFTSVDSYFTDAPQSPGGTGGVGMPDDDFMVNDGESVAEETRSFFQAYQIDPLAEDTAGPKFVVAADVDKDGLLDLMSAWNESQPVQLHLQRRDAEGNISFRTITLGGTNPLAIMAGVEFGQLNDDNGDGRITYGDPGCYLNDDNACVDADGNACADCGDWLDVVVLAKATGYVTLCPKNPPAQISATEGEIVVLFSPGNRGQVPDGDAWDEMILVNPYVRDKLPWIHNQYPGIEFKDFEDAKTKPEWNGFTSLLVANFDGVDGDDIVVALNPGECEELGQKPPTNTVDLWTNPGPDDAETASLWGAPSDEFARNVPISIILDAPQIKDLAAMDVDSDGDLDIIATVTNAISQNIRWARNPLIPHRVGGAGGLAEVIRGTSDGWRFIASGWERRPIGELDTGADVMAIGDVDGDGSDDVLIRSTDGQIVQWFRRPNALQVQPEFPPNDPVPDRFNFPWQVYTLSEFDMQEPEGIALGDITNDGLLDVVIAAEGAVYWYDGSTATSPYDPWAPNTIIQDSGAPDAVDPAQAPGTQPTPGSGVGVTQVDTDTVINALLIVDLDGDGRNDIIGTLDRRSGAGLSDDRLVWYRNVRTEDQVQP